MNGATPFLSINSQSIFEEKIDGIDEEMVGAAPRAKKKTKEPTTSISGPGPNPTPPME